MDRVRDGIGGCWSGSMEGFGREENLESVQEGHEGYGEKDAENAYDSDTVLGSTQDSEVRSFIKE